MNQHGANSPSFLGGFKRFLNYVKGLKKIKIDFKETWSKYRNKRDVCNISKVGLFVPYDPNNNLLEGADPNFFKVFKDAAYRTMDRIYKLIRRRNTKLLIPNSKCAVTF